MKQWIKYSLPLVVGMMGLTAQADQVKGSITLGGQVLLDTQSLDTASTASFPVAFVTGGDHDFAGLAPSPVAFKSFTFNPLNASTPLASLWSFTVGGKTYAFDLAEIDTKTIGTTVIAGVSTEVLTLTGIGSLDITGEASSTGTWNFSITDASGGQNTSMQFGFSDSNFAVAPDGGMTVMMLGAALTGLGLLKRKLA